MTPRRLFPAFPASLPRPRLLPLAGACALALALAKAASFGWAVSGGAVPELVGAARASATPAPSQPVAAPAPGASPAPPPPRAPGADTPPAPMRVAPGGVRTAPPEPVPPPDPVQAAERAVLESLRNRRAALETREQAMESREAVLAAAERRLSARLEEMAAMQSRLEALERGRGEREEAGWRGLVRTYEAMRPRDAAAVFDELEMPVLLGIVDRMGERRAAPVIAAMRPDRARLLTTELARRRARASAAE